MAKRVGVHVLHDRRYEAGSSQPTIGVLPLIVFALNVSADALRFETDERGPAMGSLAFRGRVPPPARRAVS